MGLAGKWQLKVTKALSREPVLVAAASLLSLCCYVQMELYRGFLAKARGSCLSGKSWVGTQKGDRCGFLRERISVIVSLQWTISPEGVEAPRVQNWDLKSNLSEFLLINCINISEDLYSTNLGKVTGKQTVYRQFGNSHSTISVMASMFFALVLFTHALTRWHSCPQSSYDPPFASARPLVLAYDLSWNSPAAEEHKLSHWELKHRPVWP